MRRPTHMREQLADRKAWDRKRRRDRIINGDLAASQEGLGVDGGRAEDDGGDVDADETEADE